MTLRRGQHWTDLEVHINPDRTRRRQRRIRNWENFQRPDSNNINRLLAFEGTDDNEQPAQQSAPDHWMGNYDFKYQLLKQPLQVFLGDSTTPQNTALWGMRRADNPRAWVNFKAIGVNNDVPMDVFGPQRAVRWQNLWTNSTLRLQASRHKVTKQIRLSAPGHPTSFRFAMRIPDGYSYEIIDSQIFIKDENGTVQLQTRHPYGWDSATIGLNPDGSQHIRATLTETNPITIGNKSFPTFLITPNADDLASAVYPIFIDPDTTITGTTAIKDAFGYSSGDTRYNYGGSDYITSSWFVTWEATAVVKIETVDLPEAISITMFQMSGKYYGARTSDTKLLHARRLIPSWNEGTANGSIQAHVVTWASSDHLGPAWNIPMAKSSGIDYVAPVSEDTFPLKASVSNNEDWSWSFTNDGLDWPRGWKDGDYNNNGFVIHVDTYGAANAPWFVGSTEDATGRAPSFYIEYSNFPPLDAIFFGANF